MTSQVTGSGKNKREAAVCSMENTKDDSPLKARFFAVRKEVYKRFKDKQQTEQQAASAAIKRSMSERERDSEVIDVDNDITAPGASKQTNRTVTDRLIKKPSHEDFVAAWSEAVLGKGLTFDFFSDPLVRKAILVTAQCADSIITSSSTHGKDTVLPRRKTWTAKNLPATDDRLQQEAMRVLTPLYKEIGACFMGDGWQSTSNRPILNILAASDGFINVRRAFDASGQDKNMPFIANSMVAEMRTPGQENVFSCTMDGACKGAFPIIQAQLPWVQCFVCPSHAIDGFIKNALSDTGTIRIQANAMSHVEFATIPWGETMCSRIFESALQAWRVSDGMKGGTLLSCTICAWDWTSCTVSRLTVSRNPRVANCMTCSWHGGMRFTHLCTVLASSWTKHSAACNMTMRRERTFSKSWRLFLK
jgi:hypothetical protein